MRWDRLNTAAALVVVIAALLVAPVAAAVVGVGTYGARAHAAAEQAEDGYRTAAVLLEDAAPVALPGGPGGPMIGPVTALVSWRTQSGAQQEGLLLVELGRTAGDAVPIWLDGDGNVVPPPASRGELIAAGVFSAVQALVLIELAIAAGYWLVRRLLGWARLSSWEAEWARVEPYWTRRRR
ncbi:MAG TPA: hypothetical protein VK925_11080 [Jiangellaceae bacterium]|nr:hypothetical protein [Jiangellaceae bacterium]